MSSKTGGNIHNSQHMLKCTVLFTVADYPNTVANSSSGITLIAPFTHCIGSRTRLHLDLSLYYSIIDTVQYYRSH